MLYNPATQTVVTGDTLDFTANQINSTGDIALSGTDGLTLAPGQYLVSFRSDAAATEAGTVGAALALDGAALPYAVSAITVTDTGTVPLYLTAIVDLTAAQTLTVLNNTASTNTYTNSTLTLTKLA